MNDIEANFDVDALIAACVPGGSVCDPQAVADSIRSFFAGTELDMKHRRLLTSRTVCARLSNRLRFVKRHTLTPEQWCSEFARIYADLGKTGLFEAKRIAGHIQPHFCLYPPKFAVHEVIRHPEVIASILGADDIDRRGQPRTSSNER